MLGDERDQATGVGNLFLPFSCTRRLVVASVRKPRATPRSLTRGMSECPQHCAIAIRNHSGASALVTGLVGSKCFHCVFGEVTRRRRFLATRLQAPSRPSEGPRYRSSKWSKTLPVTVLGSDTQTQGGTLFGCAHFPVAYVVEHVSGLGKLATDESHIDS